MPFEIELKAHLDDFKLVKDRLSALGEYCRAYTKADSYWLSDTFVPGLRLRYDSSIGADGASREAIFVTHKHKTFSEIGKLPGGMEVNEELEFSISDKAAFETLLTRLGLREDICKEKKGWAWLIPSKADGQGPILAELSEVTGLGWFLELEIMGDDNSPQTVENSRGRLLDLLKQLEVPEDCIESRPYTEMLRELRS